MALHINNGEHFSIPLSTVLNDTFGFQGVLSTMIVQNAELDQIRQLTLNLDAKDKEKFRPVRQLIDALSILHDVSFIAEQNDQNDVSAYFPRPISDELLQKAITLFSEFLSKFNANIQEFKVDIDYNEFEDLKLAVEKFLVQQESSEQVNLNPTKTLSQILSPEIKESIGLLLAWIDSYEINELIKKQKERITAQIGAEVRRREYQFSELMKNARTEILATAWALEPAKDANSISDTITSRLITLINEISQMREETINPLEIQDPEILRQEFKTALIELLII